MLFIPHISIFLIFLLYILIGASIIQEIESNKVENNCSLIKSLQEERERLLIKIIEKREIFDLQQYTKYVYKHLRQYEEEIKSQYLNFEENSSLNFSKFLFFITTTLTTIGKKNYKKIIFFCFLINKGSNEFIPKTKIGKSFLMIYTGFGIPLTLVFLTDLSYLIKQLIKNILLICFYIYSSKYFLHIRRSIFFHVIDEDEEELNISKISSNNLTITQLILILFIYILIGTCFISSKSFFESFYLCFTIIFTINLNTNIRQENNLVFIIIYSFCGLAIVLLCIKTINERIEKFLTIIEKKLFQNLINWTQQIGNKISNISKNKKINFYLIGFHDFDTEDLLSNTDMNSSPVFFRHQHLTRTKSLEQSSAFRPIGIAEPLRRLSTGFIRAFKTTNDNDENKKVDKSVQVTTIIRRCGRCAETSLPIQSIRQHSILSPSVSPMTDYSSGCEDDDIMELPPPNLDRIRQRRATLVAKTIISQMATQPRSSSIDELMSPLTFLRSPQSRSGDVSPVSVRCSVKVSTSPPPPDTPRKRSNSQAEFLEISKQISALLTISDDENELG